MIVLPRAQTDVETQPVVPPAPTICGAAIGFLAGLTGTGGGIFLSPLVLLAKWADAKRTAATSVVFILVNSLAGLAGNVTQVGSLPPNIPYLLVAAGLGGLVGSELGSKRLDNTTIRRVLAVVLVVAGMKLVLL